MPTQESIKRYELTQKYHKEGLPMREAARKAGFPHESNYYHVRRSILKQGGAVPPLKNKKYKTKLKVMDIPLPPEDKVLLVIGSKQTIAELVRNL